MNPYQKKAECLLQQMTEEERISLLSGGALFAMSGVERLGIPSYPTSDGPHGVKLLKFHDGQFGPVGKPTCFPTASALANSWNRTLVRKMGRTLGKECQLVGTGVSLGPGVNIKRHPLCGRNFEYYSEDPYLAGELGSEVVMGVQDEGVPVSVKHFAVNNQEYRRTTSNSVIEERALREIYLAVFERIVKKAKPATIMCSYNQINGTFSAHNYRLLTEILREEWGFEGAALSDWGAVHDRIEALKAGLDLDMPGGNERFQKDIKEALLDGRLTEEEIELGARRVLELILFIQENKQPEGEIPAEKHHAIARELAAECMVLLKNDGILPLSEGSSLAVIGELAENIRYQGGGSSMVMNQVTDCPLSEIRKLNEIPILYARGYDSYESETKSELLSEAIEAACKVKTVVAVVGLPYGYESEEYDRYDMKLPENQRILLQELAKRTKNLVVVFCAGAAVETDWDKEARAVLYASLAGEGSGYALAQLLYGKENPSGKLAETFPVRLSHTPAYLNYPGREDSVYKEGIYVGYRYYDKKEIEPKYPFGYGLSYTTFSYEDLDVTQEADRVKVTCRIKNTGSRTGKEVVQLYVADVEATIDRPLRELKGFEKISLEPGESRQVTFFLGKRDFSWYEPKIAGWYLEKGAFEVEVGSSSRDIRLKERIWVSDDTIMADKYTDKTLIRDLRGDREAYQLMVEHTAKMPAANLPGYDHPVGPMGMDKRKQREGMALGKLADGDGANDAFVSREELSQLLLTINNKQGKEENHEKEKEYYKDCTLFVHLPDDDRLW